MNVWLEFINNNSKVFTSIGILLTFIVSIISLYISFRNNKSVHYINAITKSRIEWIQSLRESVSEFISLVNIYFNAYYKGDFDKSGEHLSKCKRIGCRINLLLNCCDDRDVEIIRIIDTILNSYLEYYNGVHDCQIVDEYFQETQEMKRSKKLVEDNIKLLISKIQIYLKMEWNRVKYESSGKIYERETEKFDYDELVIKVRNPKYKNKIWKRFFINSRAKLIKAARTPSIILTLILVLFILIICVA